MSAPKNPFGRLHIEWLNDEVFTEHISGEGVRLRYLLTTVACRDFSDGWISKNEMRRWSRGNGDVEELISFEYLQESQREVRPGFFLDGYELVGFLDEQKSRAEREAEKEDQRNRTARSRANKAQGAEGATAGKTAASGRKSPTRGASRAPAQPAGRSAGGAQETASEPAPAPDSEHSDVTSYVTRDSAVTSHVSNNTSTVQSSTDSVVAFPSDLASRDGVVVASVSGDDGAVDGVLPSVARVASADGRQIGLNQISSAPSPEVSDGWSTPSRNNWPTSSSDPLLENSSPNRLPVDPQKRFVPAPAGSPDEVQGSENYDLPLTAAQAQRLLNSRVNPRRFVRKMRETASKKGWNRIDWEALVKTQKPTKDISVKDDAEFASLMDQLGTVRGVERDYDPPKRVIA